MYNVYQPWDPLKVCVVGRSYPPEFYNWVTVPHVRELFERIARETEEDYLKVIDKLHEFGVEVLRPNLPANTGNKLLPPPIAPRDFFTMIGDTLFTNARDTTLRFQDFYKDIKDVSWPDCQSMEEFDQLPEYIKDECINIHKLNEFVIHDDPYADILDRVRKQGNKIISNCTIPASYGLDLVGSMVSKIGKDLYFGTKTYDDNVDELKSSLDPYFPNYRTHVVNTGGHSDATYCPVCPGLIISLKDVPTYADTYPGWEVVYLEHEGWSKIKPWHQLREKNQGRWWIPGFEHDQDVVDTVGQYLTHWLGYVEETVFDINMLVIDPKNIMLFSYNEKVFNALERHGITPHVVPFRHRYFWDAGVHCITNDLHREGTMQNYFTERD